MTSQTLLVRELRTMLVRDLHALDAQVAAYPTDAMLWQLLPGLTNSGGTLVLHLVGNLRHYIGAVLGRTGYVRNRVQEFAERDVSRAALQERISAVRHEVQLTLDALDPAVLDTPFPELVGNVQLGTRAFLLHLAAHLTYHAGQIDAHRRIAGGDASTVGMLSLTALDV